MTDLPETFDDLVDKRRFWPGAAGSLDEGLGMLRLLTPDVVADAAKEIQTGRRVCLNWDLEKLDPPGFGRQKFSHSIHWVLEGVAFDDVYHMNPQQSSQWDGLRHHSAPCAKTGGSLFYGGTTGEEIQDSSNHRIGIGHWAKQGIAGRGVLIDYLSYAERQGIKVDALSQHVVTLDDVLTIAKECNITFKKGDIFFLRVGLTKTWDRLGAEQKQAYSEQQSPQHAGLEQSERVVRFLWDNHFSAVASDTVSFEVYPALQEEWDLHHFLLAGWGIPIGEMFDLEGLAELCKEVGRWTFFVSSSPLNCARGVSSPPNCMAIM